MPPTYSRPSPHSVLDDLPFCLARATLGFRRLSDQSLRSFNLPLLVPGAASILHSLHEERPCTVNRLVERTHLPNGTLTGLLDELELAGFLARFPNPDDGRSWLVDLTTPGLCFCQKLQRRHRLVMSIFAQSLTGAEQTELVRLLAKATKCMRSYQPERKGLGSKLRRTRTVA